MAATSRANWLKMPTLQEPFLSDDLGQMISHITSLKITDISGTPSSGRDNQTLILGPDGPWKVGKF